MKEKRKRIGRVRPVVVNKVGMEIRLNITMEVTEGDEVVVGGKVVAAKGGKDILFITPNVNKKLLAKELGQVCSKYKVVIIEKFK